MATILFLAEDDPLMSGLYTRAFRFYNFDYKVASDGEKALEILKSMEVKPAAIILDIMMPKKNGFEVLKELKEDNNLKNIPVILLSNLSGDDDIKKGLELGAEMCLIKSQYNSKEIVDKIKEIIVKYENKIGTFT